MQISALRLPDCTPCSCVWGRLSSQGLGLPATRAERQLLFCSLQNTDAKEVSPLKMFLPFRDHLDKMCGIIRELGII